MECLLTFVDMSLPSLFVTAFSLSVICSLSLQTGASVFVAMIVSSGMMHTING